MDTRANIITTMGITKGSGENGINLSNYFIFLQ